MLKSPSRVTWHVWTHGLYRPYVHHYTSHIWAIRKLYSSHVQPTVQATDGPYSISRKWCPLPPCFLHICHSSSVTCTVDCKWLMYSLCMAHMWTMYDLYVAYIVLFLCMPRYLLVHRFLIMIIWAYENWQLFERRVRNPVSIFSAALMWDFCHLDNSDRIHVGTIWESTSNNYLTLCILFTAKEGVQKRLVTMRGRDIYIHIYIDITP